MPRWPDEMSDCTVFLYHSAPDAEAGKNTGGSGFLVGVRWKSNPKLSHIYAVTNYHVAKGQDASVIRLNTKDGKSACIETEPHQWFHNHGRDLAVYRIEGAKHFRAGSIYDYKWSGFWEIELTDDTWQKFRLGIGDEVVSIGRFIDLSGVQRNQPFLRSGVLATGQPITVGQDSSMPWAEEESYIVEMRSRSGFSGSPVYIFVDPFEPRFVEVVQEVYGDKLPSQMFGGPWLLGVHWGQLPIVGPDHVRMKGASSGMLAVVPCSALSELLMKNADVLQERHEYEKRWKKGPHAVAEAAEPPTKADNPQHKEDFNSLLHAAARKRTQDDQT